MHKRINKRYVSKIRGSFFKLAPKLIFGGWADDFQIICLTKRYYGEKYAFFLFYFFTYQANLIIPMLLGLPLTIYSLYCYMKSSKIGDLDSIYNTLYAFSMILWSTIFVEKWKNNQ